MIKFNELFDCKEINNKGKNDDNLKEKNKIPWVDKYRPKKINDVVSQDDVIKMLRNILETGNMPQV